MRRLNRVLAALVLVFMICSVLVSCEADISGLLGIDIGELLGGKTPEITEISITNGESIELEVGETVQLVTDVPETALHLVKWSTSSTAIHLSGGTVTATSEGMAVVIASYGTLSNSITIYIVDEKNLGENSGNNGGNTWNPDENLGGNLGAEEDPYGPDVDPYADISKEEFYADYEPAISYYDSYWRSYHGFMSGELGEQDQAPTISTYRPVFNGDFVRNSVGIYGDNGNSYTVVDAYGRPVMKIYRGGGYIMLEEVAAHLFAFGEITANHTKSKSTKPTSSVWGEYLRLNHTKFSGSTTKYPYEPVLPDISGCGGNTVYYELDIGTTGTDCDPSYPSVIYNNGSSITRGAARIVYTVSDTNGNKIIDINEKYLFYTYNHYNDFQEYLNYYGGWGEMFGNITGGGKISSKYDYNPTPYVRTVRMDISKLSACVIFEKYFLVIDNKVYA